MKDRNQAEVEREGRERGGAARVERVPRVAAAGKRRAEDLRDSEQQRPRQEDEAEPDRVVELASVEERHGDQQEEADHDGGGQCQQDAMANGLREGGVRLLGTDLSGNRRFVEARVRIDRFLSLTESPQRRDERRHDGGEAQRFFLDLVRVALEPGF